jgi:hypothetical protein
MAFQGDAAGHPWPCPLPASWSTDLGDRQPLTYAAVEPTLVVEVEQDTARDGRFGKLRHRAATIRIRAELRPSQLPLIGES